jgi:hypothetical protein
MNEVPERIWVHELSAKELNVPLKEYHIEYIRTDAFIKKACEWLKSNLYDYAGEDDMGSIVPFDSSIFEDFKNYMKGE